MTATRIDRGSTETMKVYSEGGDLVFERTFDAPREQVWKALTDPELIPRWWGPHGTTTTVVEMDVRPGGKWRYISRAADREDVAFYGEYLEVEPPRGFKWTFIHEGSVEIEDEREHRGSVWPSVRRDLAPLQIVEATEG